jgi:tetratricopeptide (TPR) repeat protein
MNKLNLLLIWLLSTSSYYSFSQTNNYFTELELQETQKIKYFPNDLQESYQNRAWARIQLGKYLEAISDCDSSLIFLPQNYLCWLYKGISYYNLSFFKKSIVALDNAIKYNNNSQQCYYNRALAYTKLDKIDNAIINYSKVIELNNLDSDSYFNRGILYLRRNSFINALNDFTHCINLSPNNINNFLNRAKCYYNLKSYDEALSDINRAFQMDSTNAYVYLYYGIVYDLKDQKNLACLNILKAIELGLKVDANKYKYCF